MIYNYLKIPGVLLLFLSSTLSAQQGLAAAGGGINGPTMKVSFSVGQTAYSYTTNGTNNITEGLQQSYNVTVLAVTEAENLRLMVFPNPTSEFLSIQGNEDLKKLEYILYDAQGKMVQKGKIAEAKNFLNLSQYPQSIYLLEIISENAPKQIFKIIKK